MALIQVKDLTFGYDGNPDNVFEHVTFQMDTNWKLGFIGRNGRGKTTFLRLLLGEYPYRGTISCPVPVAYFPFPVPHPEQDTQAVVEALAPDYELWRLQRELSLLRVDAEVLDRPFCTLSNGEQTKVLLGTLFLKEHAFLLIDEPTNHLDSAAREKVADYLSQKKGFILVSHDRDFMDRCVDHVLVLNRSSIEIRKGNFSSWQEDKTARDNLELRQNEQLQKDIRKLKEAARQAERWSDKLESTKTGTRSSGLRPDRGYIGHHAAKMMKRSLNLERRRENAVREKEQLLKDVETIEDLRLNTLAFHSRRLASLNNVSIQYNDADRPLITDFRLEIMQGDRIALSGRNGCGKSSVIKLLLGEDIPHTGEVYVAEGLKISYISQDTSFLRGSLSEFAYQCGLDDSLFRAVLRKLGLERAQFDKKIQDYSEGQKKKVLLARSLCEPAHLFIWDEPLNYIDVFSRMQLEDLILSFQPTLLFVEHDRISREKIATQTVEFMTTE